MEENKDIFLAGGDTLVYLTVPMHKKYSTEFVGDIHLVRTYLFFNDFSTPLLPCKDMYAFRVTLSAVRLLQKNYFKHSRTYVFNNMTQMQISTNKTRHHMAKTWKEIV